MNNEDVIKRLNTYPNLQYSFSNNRSKVEAFNRDLDAYEFDIVLVVHDDMVPAVKGYDQIIVENMLTYFPDLDGVLNFNDGFVAGQCNTLPVMGKKFYQRFGYIYNPAYKALVCNVELTCISKMLKKEKVIDQVIIKHNHPAWGAGPMDDLYETNGAYHQEDVETFIQRRTNCFDLDQEEVAAAHQKLWSILICTIEEREESFNSLCERLKHQIKELSLENEIEIIVCLDKKGEHTVGYKRNKLLEQSQGTYVQFIDDDDTISDDFIKVIYEKLKHNPDCVSLTGIITCNDLDEKLFIHSIKYNSYFEHNNIYFRPPNHLNPIKRSIAVQFSFPEKSFGEDTDWAMAIAQSKLLKTEEVINTPYYFYLYKDK